MPIVIDRVALTTVVEPNEVERHKADAGDPHAAAGYVKGAEVGGQGTLYEHVQGSAAALWTITHNLNTRPSVTVVDSSGRVVEGDVLYVSSNQITVAFAAAFSGRAYLN